MSEQDIRKHLRSALAEVIEAEQTRVAAILGHSTIKHTEGVEKMRPLITLIRALKEEVGEFDGLDIDAADHGHMATVRADTSVTSESLSISTNYDNSAFVIEEYSSFSIDNSCQDHRIEFLSTEDVMTRVLDVVGKHIGAQQAQKAHRDA